MAMTKQGSDFSEVQITFQICPLSRSIYACNRCTWCKAELKSS